MFTDKTSTVTQAHGIGGDKMSLGQIWTKNVTFHDNLNSLNDIACLETPTIIWGVKTGNINQ